MNLDGARPSTILHATLIAAYGGGEWRGVLLRGASGSGKSGLALRAMEAGFRLVADDRVIVWRSGKALFGRAPDTLAGLIEVRGVGVIGASHLRFCRIALVADLAGSSGTVNRVPYAETVCLNGIAVSLVRLHPFEAPAPQALLAALAAVQRPL